MNLFAGSMFMAILAILLYHVSQKMIPTQANLAVSLIVTYSVALLTSVLIYPFFAKGIGFVDNVKGLNGMSVALGLVIVLMEVSFLLVYRSGWQLSRANLFANVSVAVVSIPLGLFFFKESLSPQNILGFALALVGIVLMAR